MGLGLAWQRSRPDLITMLTIPNQRAIVAMMMAKVVGVEVKSGVIACAAKR